MIIGSCQSSWESKGCLSGKKENIFFNFPEKSGVKDHSRIERVLPPGNTTLKLSRISLK